MQPLNPDEPNTVRRRRASLGDVLAIPAAACPEEADSKRGASGPATRRGSLSGSLALPPDEPVREAELSYIGQLAAGRKRIDALMSTAEERLTNPAWTRAIDETGALHDVVDWLGRQAFAELERLSEGHRASSREALQATNAIHEMKLATQRKAASVSLQDKARELEAAAKRKLGAQLAAAMSAEDGAALTEAHAENERLTAQLAALTSKASGLEEALSTTRTLLSVAEERNALLEAETVELHTKCAAMEEEVRAMPAHACHTYARDNLRPSHATDGLVRIAACVVRVAVHIAACYAVCIDAEHAGSRARRVARGGGGPLQGHARRCPRATRLGHHHQPLPRAQRRSHCTCCSTRTFGPLG
jgi:hypothetical protein